MSYRSTSGVKSHNHIFITPRLLPRPAEEGVDRDGPALVQGALQATAALREGETAGPSLHSQCTAGKQSRQQTKTAGAMYASVEAAPFNKH